MAGEARERAQQARDHEPVPAGEPADGPATSGAGRETQAGGEVAPAPRPDDRPDAPTVKLTADGQPRPHGRRGTWLLIKRTLVRAWDDNIFSESASAAFWQTLSLPPLLLGLLGSLGYIGVWFGPDTIDLAQQQLVRGASQLFSDNAVDEIIAPTVATILTTGRSELVSLGFVISLWSGSSAMSSFVDAITVAHDQYGVRNEVWQRIFALLLYMAALVLLVIGLPILALGPNLLPKVFPVGWRSEIG